MFLLFKNNFFFGIIGDKNHSNFDDRQTHFNPPQMHYDNGGQYSLLCPSIFSYKLVFKYIYFKFR